MKAFNRKCCVCFGEFISKASNAKTCSEQCFIKHRINRRKNTEKKNSKKWKCRNCNANFYRQRKRNGFCSRSCASKFHVKNGTYDNWQKTGVQINKNKIKPLVEQQCLICHRKYHIKLKEHKRNRSKTCSISCRREYTSKKLSGPNNHFWGRRFPKKWEEKRKQTLQRKYGVRNAFALAKKRRKSKGQMALFESLSRIFPEIEIQVEKLILKKPHSIFGDILLPENKIIVEYNGDFWHCNPYKYKPNYHNPKKGMKAYQVWQEDKNRIKKLTEAGYKVFIVWEHDFKTSKEETLLKLTEEIKHTIQEQEERNGRERRSIDGR